ncbi:hypothetical protein ACIA8O_17745 [Kitasatospora sp. NPDC051853]|uniref:hypothetical protein n=1 Tax=Kitasatospora sp. NPDC051853 TaxID=3364058 RepID=UPI003796A68F
MDGDLRRAAVVALVGLGRSPDSRDRAAAGQALAAFAELPRAGAVLLDLVLDAEDTFVTRTTTEALLRRHDRAGLAVVASALAVADDGHGDWIGTAVHDVFGIFAVERDAALRRCEELSRKDDDRLVRGARALHELLTDLDPVLHPVPRA